MASAAAAGVLAATLAAGDPLPIHTAAAALPGPPRSAVATRVAWTPCGPPKGLQCARIRVPLDWDQPSGRTISLALIRHLASKPDERMGTMFINPGGPGDTRRRPGAGRPCRARRLGRRSIRRRQLGSAWQQCQHPGALLPQQAERGEVLGGRRDPHHEGRLGALPAQDRRSGAALRRGQRLAPAPHLDRRHRPRPRPSAPPGRRPQAHLRRPLLRHLSRPDLREHVSRPRQGDDARRHRRSGPVLEGGRGEGRRGVIGSPTRSSTSSSPSATKPGRSVARSPVGPAPRPSASSGCSRG